MNYKKKLGHDRLQWWLVEKERIDMLPKRTAAALMATERPDLFSSVEAARLFVRALTGSLGARNDMFKGHKTDAKSTIAEGLSKLKAYKEALPDSIYLTDCKILLLTDIHLPYHDIEALTAAIEYGKKQKPDVIVLNGDVLDCYGISRFQSEMNRPTLAEELQAGRDFLTLLRAEFPTTEIIFKIGNHEERLRHYILMQAKELHDLPDLRLSVLLNFEGLGITEVGREIIKAGKLNIMHGHEMGESVFSPVNPARGYFLKAKCSAIVGHYHQVSYHSESNLNGDEVGVWSVGCLCSLQPEYRPYAYTKWRHGFAVIDVDKDGGFEVFNHQIINGRVR